MYLMNVPPVAATQTEWRTCGPTGGYSLPVCFNDSDPELSSRGTPISDKVQMIIESLRSTQSSLEMGDEIEGNVLSGREGHPQACKAAVGSYVGARPKVKVLTGNRPADVSSLVNHESNDSDSDDSVDRGIEEAILEYLKEKDGHKRKAEPCFNFLQSSKIPRKDLPVPEVSNQNSNSNTFLIPTNQFPKSLKAETPTVPAAIPIKKYIKHKASLEENTTRQFAPTKSVVLPKEQMQTLSKSISHLKTEKGPVNVKVEADLSDSSSDDGIEEAIQRYQLEKKEQQVKREVFNPHEFSEDSDSSSDDGIEEAIRRYQLEQLKEKSAFKPFLHKQTTLSKSLIHAAGSTSIENVNKRKLKKKKSRTEKEAKAAQPHPLSISAPKSTLSESLKAKGNGFPSLKMESPNDPPTPTSAPVKVNTTAELMCAEAILDISKTVMPGGFHHGVSLSCYTPSESSLPDNGKDEESDGSSIDSEDGIEQEIRKFLEQKAQMHQQPTDPAKTPEAQSINQQEVKAKQVTAQKKPLKLSLTQRRKHREENSSLSAVENKVKETSTKPLPEHRKEPSQRNLQGREQSGDKSSSLDSDEDLDTAIKDLLKTKKKTKKKRDLKVKSRKCPKDEEPVLGNASQPKKLKHNLTSKRSALKKVQKDKDNMKDKFGVSKRTVLPHKQAERSTNAPKVEMGNLKALENKDPLLLNPQTSHQMRDDSSSVDSDDSIEQEIRRFLAEKAKGSTAEKGRDEDVSRNGTDVTIPQDKKDKQEDQLAEIPIKSTSPFVGRSPSSYQPVSVPHSSQPDIPSVGVQLHMSAVLPCSPSRLEPADGAGAAKTEQKRPSFCNEESPSTERVRQVSGPSIAHSCSESIKWRQSLGLPTPDARTLSRTPFHITASKISETPSESAPYQSGVITSRTQTPVNAWSSARTSRGPFQAEMTVNSPYRSTVLNLSSLSKQHPRMAFSRSFGPDHRPLCTMEGETKSMVHIPKDKSVFVELESNRTNHVQVRSRERSEGKDLLSERKREGESMKIDEKEVHLERGEEEFIDEADCESGSRRSPEKKQGFPTLSLSSAIDPGIIIRPCIALSTDERSKMFSRRYHSEENKKAVPSLSRVPVQKKAVQCVKRKLQFIPVNRESEASGHSYKHVQAVLHSQIG